MPQIFSIAASDGSIAIMLPIGWLCTSKKRSKVPGMKLVQNSIMKKWAEQDLMILALYFKDKLLFRRVRPNFASEFRRVKGLEI